MLCHRYPNWVACLLSPVAPYGNTSICKPNPRATESQVRTKRRGEGRGYPPFQVGGGGGRGDPAPPPSRLWPFVGYQKKGGGVRRGAVTPRQSGDGGGGGGGASGHFCDIWERVRGSRLWPLPPSIQDLPHPLPTSPTSPLLLATVGKR